MTKPFRQSINWGQAFAEVVLIFIGVGVALLADRWVDERNQREEERQYLLSLRADFEETKVSLQRSLEDIRRNRDLKLKLMRLMQGPPDAIKEDELSQMIQESFYMQMPAATMATYADMVNSGDLRLLRDATLRLKLAEFENGWRDYWSVIEEGFSQWNQLQVPFLVSRARIASVYSSGYGGVEFPVSHQPIDRKTFWSREFENILAVSVISREDMISVGEQMVKKTIEILQLIDRSLEMG